MTVDVDILVRAKERAVVSLQVDEATDDLDILAADVTAGSSRVPFRPIQYLGNKLRALPQIVDAGATLIGRGGHVADLFTGTSVVAQGFAHQGFQVTAADTQRYAVIFAQAMLGIGRRPGESCSSAALSRMNLANPIAGFREAWEPFLEREAQALVLADATILAALAPELPLIWREPGNTLRQNVEASERRSALGELPLLTAVYAGSYFGVRQAIVLDELRQNAGLARAAGRLSDWQYSAVLTAIMAAASAVAHSAGKHFAQPLNAGSLRNKAFLNSRILQDRRIDVEREFAMACDMINAQAVSADVGHHAWHGSAESFVASDVTADLYYLDPPYTAQQYSRFYHVLETVCTYEYPQLFDAGRLTTGLYPTDRYKSAFSSKRKAPAAFQTIINAARTVGASLAISYSQSAAASDGNARMITLEQLLDLCSAEFGTSRVDWFQLSHRYRQFNSSSASNAYRDDPEILITCRPR